MADGSSEHRDGGAPARVQYPARRRVVMLLDNHFAPDRRVLRELQLLASNGIDSTVIAWDRRTTRAAKDVEVPPGARVERVSVPAPAGGGIRTLRALLLFSMRVWSNWRGTCRDADLLVVHDLYLLPLGVALSWWLNVPLGYDAHEDYAVMERGRLPDWLLRFAERLESLLARRAAILVVPGEVRKGRWIRAGFAPPVVLANSGTPTDRSRTNGASDEGPSWDLVYCGLIDASRRLDLLIDLARKRPDLRIAVAGDGRSVAEPKAAAGELENFDFLGWVDRPDSILERSRAVYYGLDPLNPYADSACPNNLYQAIRAQRPLIYFCGGEVEEVASRFRIGVRVAPNVDELAGAVDDVIASTSQSWQFREALRAVEAADSGAEYVDAMRRIVRL